MGGLCIDNICTVELYKLYVLVSMLEQAIADVYTYTLSNMHVSAHGNIDS